MTFIIPVSHQELSHINQRLSWIRWLLLFMMRVITRLIIKITKNTNLVFHILRCVLCEHTWCINENLRWPCYGVVTVPNESLSHAFSLIQIWQDSCMSNHLHLVYVKQNEVVCLNRFLLLVDDRNKINLWFVIKDFLKNKVNSRSLLNVWVALLIN